MTASTWTTAGDRRGWLHPSIVGAAVLAVAAGYAQFGVTAVLGDVATAFGAAGEGGGGLAEDVGLQATTLGLGLAIVRLAAIGSLPAASLADRHGRRRLLLWLVAAGLALSVASSASPGFWVFVAVVAAARPLLSGANTIATVIAAEETTSVDRSKAIAFVGAAYAFGSGIVAVVHGVGADRLGFRGVLALSALGLVLVPVVGRFVEEPPVFARHPTEATRRLGAVPRELLPRLAIVAGLAAGVAVVTGPAFTFLFVYGENVLGASPGYMAGLILAAGPTGLVGLLLGRWAADRGGRRITAGLAMGFVAVGGVVTYSGSIVAMSAGYLLTVVAAAAFGPPKGALIAEVFPTAERATAGGWTAAAGVLGSTLGLVGLGALSDAFGGFGTAAMLLFLPVVPLGSLYVFLPETRGMELDEAIP